MLVMRSDPCLLLRRYIEDRHTKVVATSDCEEARRLIESGPQVDIVFTDARLRDGDWHSVARAARRVSPDTRVVVCLPRTDGGWIDMLESGAFAVLAEPLESDQVNRLVDQAAASRTLC